jgi:hypothetical protein
MKTSTTLVTTLFALASYSLLAQQPPPAGQLSRPATQQNAPVTEPDSPNTPTAGPRAATVEMSPVNGELLSKLDSKTAKTGDGVIVQTEALVKTADGTEIPKGSKLVGHVLGAKPSGAGENSQVVLQFDHLELKGGQNLPVHSQIESIAPAGSEAATSPSSGTSSDPSTNGSKGGSMARSAPQGTGADPGATPAGKAAPAAGTVIARTGNIAIATTSVPGVLLANNAPGQQDPRMAQASSILLGAKQDIQLDGGTRMVLGVATTGGGTQ